MRYADGKKSSPVSRRIFVVLLIILMIVAAILTINTIKRLNHKEETRQVEAMLYGYRTSGNIILQDTNGQLWEIDYTDLVTDETIVLLDVTGYKINRAFIEIPKPTETVNQG